MNVTITNEERSAAEVVAFHTELPARYFAYHNAKQSDLGPARRLRKGDKITTWTGEVLADVIETHEPFCDNFGGTRQNFRAWVADPNSDEGWRNGVTYSGTAYLSAGDYVRMRKVAA